ncbi:MAG: polysaccharide biosynthesis tyrosine autokinase [Sumerlaeia bacterium]
MNETHHNNGMLEPPMGPGADDFRNPSSAHQAGAPAQTTMEEESTFDVTEYIEAILKRKWLILLAAAIGLALGGIQVRNATPVYTSMTTIKYEPSTPRIVEFGDISARVAYQEEFSTQLEMIRSPLVTRRVIEALGADRQVEPAAEETENTSSEEQQNAPAADPSPFSLISKNLRRLRNQIHSWLAPYKPVEIDEEISREQGLVSYYQNKVRVRQQADTKLISIMASDTDAHSAARIADTFAEQYIESLKASKSESYQGAIEYLFNQRAQLQDEIKQAREALNNFEGPSEVRVMDQALEVALNRYKGLKTQIANVEDRLARLKTELETYKGENADAVLEFRRSQNDQYRVMTSRLNDLRVQLAAMLGESTQNNPQVQRVQREISALEQQINQISRLNDAEMIGEITLSEAELGALNRQLSQVETEIGEVRSERVEYEVLQRDLDSATRTYDTILSRLEEVEIASKVEFNNVTIVSNARIPRFPTYPRVMRTIAQHGVLGLVVGIVFALGIYKLDRSVRDPSQVEARLGLPTLGQVPFIKNKGLVNLVSKSRNRRIRLINQMDTFSTEAEAFKLLRTSLQYSTPGHSPRVILVTSCLPREGKSTVSSNLAISYAGRGGKVLLIDADMKLPIVHQTFQVNRNPGLAEVLTGQKNWREVVQPSGVDNLEVMVAGQSVPSPADLLESEAMVELLAELRQNYETIIVDSAPLHGMSDSYVLGPKVDGIAIVVNVGGTKTELLNKTVGALRAMHVRVLGVVYNYQTKGAHGVRYYYDYYYGYKYGYRYGNRYDRSGVTGEEAAQEGRRSGASQARLKKNDVEIPTSSGSASSSSSSDQDKL